MTFDNKVRYYGDGSQSMSQLDTGSLDDVEELMSQGKMFGSDLTLRTLQDSLRYIHSLHVLLTSSIVVIFHPLVKAC